MNTQNWRIQMQQAITSQEDLLKHANLNNYQKDWLQENFSKNPLPFFLTPYFASLIKPIDNCPIFMQVISSSLEQIDEDFLVPDPLGEEEREKTPHLVHRYPDRVLFLASDRCASYCRFCTRKRWVGQGPTPQKSQAEEAFNYIKNNQQIKEIIFSGGDPLILSNQRIKYLLDNAFSIDHIDVVRIHSRMLSFLPMRIDDELIDILKKYSPIYLVTHFNHPDEITAQTIEAINKLISAGVVLLNQSVMLKNINDDVAILTSLFRTLVKSRIKPYYLHQCDLIKGSAHFRVPIKQSLEIFSKLRGNISGLCMPSFIVETPGGFGKIALSANPIIKEDDNFIYLQGFKGDIAAYPKE